MTRKISQFLVFATILIMTSFGGHTIVLFNANAQDGIGGQETKGVLDSSSVESESVNSPTPDTNLIRQNAFNNAVKDFSEGDARLGNELASLPGPNISFNDLLRVIITWSASLAASVAIFIFVLRSFAAISGTEEAHNQWKSSILKILIGLVLIFFSYQIIAFVMGILWAT